MKKTILLLSIILTINTLHSQSYYYSKRIESMRYLNSNGDKATKLIKSENGNYKLVFEIGELNGKSIPLFSEYINNIDQGYYTLHENLLNREISGKIYETGIYFSTLLNTTVNVFISTDKNNLIIFTNNKVIEYKK